MQDFFQQVLNWSNIDDMAVRFTKTKEMVMGPVAQSSNLPFRQWVEGQIERVSSFKLLGLHLDADFSWHFHVEAVTSKATKRLYFLKQLKRAGVPHAQLLHNRGETATSATREKVEGIETLVGSHRIPRSLPSRERASHQLSSVVLQRPAEQRH